MDFILKGLFIFVDVCMTICTNLYCYETNDFNFQKNDFFINPFVRILSCFKKHNLRHTKIVLYQNI